MIVLAIGLFLGRFQPLHLGHLKDIKRASAECDQVIIGIGSSQEENTVDNPFSFEERKTMIRRTLDHEGIANYSIKGVIDINNDDKYVAHVKTIVLEFDVVYTGSRNTQKLFEAAGYKVIFVKLYQDIHATTIRDNIAKKCGWELLVPGPVHDYILEIDGIGRIEKLYRSI